MSSDITKNQNSINKFAKVSIPARLSQIILAAYLVWGLAGALVLKMFYVKRSYYELAGMALLFVVLTAVTGRLHIGEFVVRYWRLTAVAALCTLYQFIIVGVSHRTIINGLTMYLLIYTGFLYGKRFGEIPGKILKALAVLLASSSAVGIIWWINQEFPLAGLAEKTAQYFISAPHRMVSVYLHPIIAAYFILVLVAAVLFSFGDASTSKNKLLDIIIRFILLAIGVAGIYATSTRSAYLIVVALPILWFIRERHLKKHAENAEMAQNTRADRVKLIAIFSIFVIIGIAIVGFTGIRASIYNRFFGTNWRDDPSYTFRIDAMKVVADNTFGNGIGRFLFGIGAGKAISLIKGVDWIVEKYEVIPAIDNSFGTMFIEQGVFALLLFLHELLIVIKNCLRSHAPYKSRQLIYFLLIPQLIMSLTFDAQTWPGTEFLLFVMIGMEMAWRSYLHPGFSEKHPLIINGRIYAQNVTGVQRYGIEIIKQIDKMVKPGEVILALPQGELQTKPDFSNIKTEVIGKGNGNKWTQFHLPVYAIKKRGTILTLAGIAPAIKPDYVATHDISFMRYPDSYGKSFRIMYRLGYFLTLYRCKGIITISGFSKNELINFYQLDEDRFTIAGNSAEQLLEEEYTEQDLSKWGLADGQYYLSVGSKNLHKNQKFIKKLAEKYPDRKFVVAGGSASRSFGGSGEMTEDGAEELNGIASEPAGTQATSSGKIPTNLILTGYVTDDELRTLYAHAHAFIFPSLYEGFGIPPMEAILSGVKHIALADIPVLNEVYSKGCYFFDPKNVDEFDIVALNDTSESITEDIREFYLKKYSWKNSAKNIVGAIR